MNLSRPDSIYKMVVEPTPEAGGMPVSDPDILVQMKYLNGAPFEVSILYERFNHPRLRISGTHDNSGAASKFDRFPYYGRGMNSGRGAKRLIAGKDLDSKFTDLELFYWLFQRHCC